MIIQNCILRRNSKNENSIYGNTCFSVPALEELAKVHQVAAVVTQQDRPKGRGHKMQYTPVKEKALELNIPVYQPEKVKNPEFVDILREINPERYSCNSFWTDTFKRNIRPSKVRLYQRSRFIIT